MNATELFLQNGKSAGIFFCEKCRIVASSQYWAENCCKNYVCEKCGKDTGGRSWLVCDDCRKIEENRKEKERFDKAEKILAKDYDGWVFCEGYGYQDGFSSSIEEFYEYMYDQENKDEIEYVWACKPNHFARLNMDDILANIYEQSYEDFDADDLGGIDELKVALDIFNETNKSIVSYEPDYTKAILIDKSELHNEQN